MSRCSARSAWLAGLYVVAVAAAVAPWPQSSRASDAPPDGGDAIEALRVSGNLDEQRELAWRLFESWLEPNAAGTGPALADWHNEDEVFARSTVGQRLPFPGTPIGTGFSPAMLPRHLGDAPVVTFVHYNPAAFEHIRIHGLYRRETLDELLRSGQPDPDVPGQRTIGPLPRTAAITMTGWWPVSGSGVTPMPAWDPTDAAIRIAGGNGYVNWTQVVGVDPQLDASAPSAQADVVFAGRSIRAAPRLALTRFFHVRLHQAAAERLMRDAGVRKAALIALGRPLRDGDFLALVALHSVTMAGGSGVWQTSWWDPQAAHSAFSRGRPAAMRAPWTNYVMDVALDATLPRDPDGSPRTIFNPWFEGAFPGPAGSNGIRSNCLNCHDRASYPRTEFLPIRRGGPDLRNDPAYAPGRLRTARIWALANPDTGPGAR